MCAIMLMLCNIKDGAAQKECSTKSEWQFYNSLHFNLAPCFLYAALRAIRSERIFSAILQTHICSFPTTTRGGWTVCSHSCAQHLTVLKNNCPITIFAITYLMDKSNMYGAFFGSGELFLSNAPKNCTLTDCLGRIYMYMDPDDAFSCSAQCTIIGIWPWPSPIYIYIRSWTLTQFLNRTFNRSRS